MTVRLIFTVYCAALAVGYWLSGVAAAVTLCWLHSWKEKQE